MENSVTLTAAAWERRCSKIAMVSGASCIGIQARHGARRAIPRRQKTKRRKVCRSPQEFKLMNEKERENHENYFANVDANRTWSGVSYAAIGRCSENQTGRENSYWLCKRQPLWAKAHGRYG